MKENIFNFFVAIFSFLDAGWRFLITLFLLLTLFVVNIVLTVKVKTYTERKKRAFLLLSFALILMQAFSSAILEENLSLSLFNGAIFLFTIVPFSFITKKEKKEITITKEQSLAVKKFEENIKESSFEKLEQGLDKSTEKSVLFSFEDVLKGDEKPTKTIKAISKKDENDKPLDYSNVKKAIEMTMKKDLSSEEKRKIIGLEIAILQSERGEDNTLIKEEVNEGLSSLLKIMSRYSV